MDGMQWMDLSKAFFAHFNFGVILNPEVRSEHVLSTFPRVKLFSSPLSVLDMTYHIDGNNTND